MSAQEHRRKDPAGNHPAGIHNFAHPESQAQKETS